MMKQENDFYLAVLEEPHAQVMALPFKGERLRMMIYLPNEKSSLSRLENWLKDQSPFEIQREHLSYRETVTVSLPKFKIRSSLQLNEPLKSLGLSKMFDESSANFSGIFNGPENFFVSKVAQETFIEVNEEGAEATESLGATSIGATKFFDSGSPIFYADRPFVFQILDTDSKTVLLTGRVKNPLDSGSGESAASAGQTTEPTSVKSQPAEQKKDKEAEFPLNTGKPCDQGNSPSVPPAAASGFYWRVSSNIVPDWNYNSTKNGPCFPFAEELRSVIIRDSSCVTLYKDKRCKVEKLRMITTKASLGQDIRFPTEEDEEMPKSIGVCSSF